MTQLSDSLRHLTERTAELTRANAVLSDEIAERRRVEAALREQEAVLRLDLERLQEFAGRLIVAQDAERLRLALDLHDGISQQLAGFSLVLSGFRRLIVERDQTRLEASVTRLQQQTIGLADSVQRLSHDLHPGTLQQIGLRAALESHCAEFQLQHRIEVTFRAATDVTAIATDVSLCLFRAAQEALRNVAKHAGALRTHVELSHENGHQTLTIADDGRGFDTTRVRRARDGLGLLSIEGRVRVLRGIVEIESHAGRGTTVKVAIPTAG